MGAGREGAGGEEEILFSPSSILKKKGCSEESKHQGKAFKSVSLETSNITWFKELNWKNSSYLKRSYFS